MSERDDRDADVHQAILDRLDADRIPSTRERLAARARAAAGALARLGTTVWARSAETVAAGVARLRAASGVIVRGVRSVRSAPARLLCRLPAASEILKPVIYGGAILTLALAAGLGWLEAPRPEAAVRRAPVKEEARGPLVDASDMLGDPSVAEETKLTVLENISADPDESATEVLLSAAGSESLLVSMAGIRALRGRPCDRVQASLTRRLLHDDWQRRAWAAKVLGENGCADALPELTHQLAHESDDRVRRELSRALSTLGHRSG